MQNNRLQYELSNPSPSAAAARSRPPMDEVDSDSEIEVEDDRDAATNLLHIRDPNRWTHGQEQTIQNLSSLQQHIAMNNSSEHSGNAMMFASSRTLDANGNEVAKGSEYSITRFFEPKFLVLFTKYSEAIKQPIDLSRHLMSLCLDHLVSFSCWARENAIRSQWIKTNLEDNTDLRPEVRNGLAMILIYVFSSAQSRLGKDSQNNSIDMFAVLQDADNGLGIVNKTSLKIYNDPFCYFNFLKSCISGLIDAGKIPENERQNQPKKPKRQTENKEEVFAYMQLKGLLVALLSNGEVMVARAKVQQVMTIWQQKSKTIRNRRFATALSIVSNPSQLKHKVNNNLHGVLHTASFDNGNGMLETDNNGLALMTGAIDGDHDEHDDNNHNLTSLTTLNEEAATAAAMSLVAANMGLNIDTSPTFASSNFSANFNNPMTSTNYANLGLPPAKYMRGSSSNRMAMTLAGTPSVSVLRFERVGATEWEYKEIKVYNIESLVQGFSGTFCLMDETRLSMEDKLNHRVTTQNVGFNPLPNELQQRGALLSSWPKVDHGHLLDFLECWLAQEQQNDPHSQPLSLLNFWHMNSVQGLSQLQQQIANSGNTSNGPSPKTAVASAGQGMIAYEVIMQVGFVLRKNEALGIGEDCWRLIYPRDLQSDSSSIPFGQFLSTFFPQMRSVINGIHDLTTVVVKYFPHALELPVQQPPRSDAAPAYQTIGTLDEPAIAVLARFETGLSFHDVVIQAT